MLSPGFAMTRSSSRSVPRSVRSPIDDEDRVEVFNPLSLDADLLDRLSRGEPRFYFDQLGRHEPTGGILVVLEKALELARLVHGQGCEDFALLLGCELADEIDRVVVGQFMEQLRALFGGERGQ